MKSAKKKKSSAPAKKKLPAKNKALASSKTNPAATKTNGKLTKQAEAEARKAHDLYWKSYIAGDVETLASLLDNHYTQIGSVENEVFFNKKDAVKFIKHTIDQIAGNVEMRNRSTKAEPVDGFILVHEQCDLYVLTEGVWTFYSKFRASSLMQKTEKGWKMIHQHSSLPDSKAQEGENIATEKISAENLQLREAVKRRTIELEQKNQDLEIESSLERVRAQAMGMKKPDDLLDICRKLFAELGSFGFDELRNTMINIHNDDQGSFLNYDYSELSGKTVTNISYKSLPEVANSVNQIRKSQDAFAEFSIQGKELKRWKDFRRKNGEQDDPRIEKSKGIYYYFYSIGIGAIGISTFNSIGDEKLELLKRFRNVFNLAYQRYTAITLAEAQAREAKIELALERVRARTMAMQKSEELSETVFVLHQQFRELGEDPIQMTIGIYNEAERIMEFHVTDWAGGGKQNNNTFNLSMDEPTLLKKAYTAWKAKKKSIVVDLKGKELQGWLKYRNANTGVTVTSKDTGGRRVVSIAFFSKGHISISSPEPRPTETIQLLERFAKVFDLTYTRFLDLKNAEAQAREAQIEAALERVRSRSMGMQKSNELANVVLLIIDEFKTLRIHIDNASINTDFSIKGNGWNLWIARKGKQYLEKFHIPDHENPVHIKIRSAIENGIEYYIDSYTKAEKDKYLKWLFKNSDLVKLKDDRKKYVLSTPGWARATVLSKNSFLQFQRYKQEDFTEEEVNIFKRFAKAFDQAYTRFLDLQKAEAQAREAQIETAIEKVRARSLAMQKPEELIEVAEVLRKEMGALGVEELETSSIYILNENGTTECWYAIKDIRGKNKKLVTDHMTLLLNETWVGKQMQKFHRSKHTRTSILMKGENRKEWINYCAEKSKMLKGYYGGEIPERTYHLLKFSNGFMGAASPGEISAESWDLLQRATAVFSFAYKRFSDLQKAEAQAREAQMEASLERVRAQAMGIRKSEELSGVGKTIFSELKQLGFGTIRNTEMVINNDEKEAVTSYHYSDYGKEEIIEIDYKTNPLVKKWANDLRKADDAFVPVSIAEKQMKAWNKYRKELGYKSDPKMAKAKTVHYYSYSIGLGALSVSTWKKITDDELKTLERFRNVFGLAYRRYADIALAEAQSREAKIELALERVRAKTMAMHNSEDVSTAIATLFTELDRQGIENVRCGIAIIDINKTMEVWSVTNVEEGKMVKAAGTLDMNAHTLWQLMYDDWKTKNEFLYYHLSGKEKQEYIDILNSAPGYLSQPILEMPDMHGQFYFFNEGAIWAYSLQPHTEQQQPVMKRFTSVFSQTYLRYRDLQKAEGQAREAQIEAALERVRSRSMAMHKSEDLKEVIKIVYQQLAHLKIKLDHAGFVVDYTPKGDWHFWIADEQDIPSKITHPYFDSVWAKQFDDAKEKGANFFTTQLDFEEKNKFYRELLSFVPGLPETSKDFYLTCPGLAATTVLQDNVGLYVENFKGISYSEEENAIIIRFGKVFQQTYTRFLDLQKAEAQAREAEIQLALERARSQSMTMQHSAELDDTLRVFHEQVLKLGIRSAFSFLWLPDEEKDRHIFWASWAENNSTVYKSKAINYPLDRNEPATAQCLIDWKGNEPVVSYHVPPASVESYFAAWSELIAGVEELKPANFREGLYYVEAFIKYGCFGVMVKTELPEEEKKILYRFAAEFESTYTRFLDLQKAEAQAREARIEAALEKVRSRTMGMQKSEELGDAAVVLFNELRHLVKELWTCGFVLCERERDEDEWWLSTETGFIPAFYLPNTVDVTHANIYSAWKNGDAYHTEQLEGETLKAHYDWLYNIPIAKKIFDDMTADGFALPAWQKLHCANFSKGYLVFITQVPCPEEQLFKRFAQVFEQTYVRFLDLQKAEAQAREAQIEAALERVRSRSLAMHKSEELEQVILVVSEQLQQLQFKFSNVSFGFDTEQMGLNFWMASPQLEKPFLIKVPYINNPAFTRPIQARKNGVDFNVDILSHEENREFLQHMFDFSDLNHIPAETKSFLLSTQGFARSQSLMKNTILTVGNYTPTPYSEEQNAIIKRFGNVFEQAYVRFLDLQKAEAQAREAQIEASLERVRSRSMAMHESDELLEIIKMVSEQLYQLGFKIDTAMFSLNYKTKPFELWVAGPGQPYPTHIDVPYVDIAVMKYLEGVIENGRDLVAKTFSREEKNEWIQHLLGTTVMGNFPRERKEFILNAEGIAVSIVLLKQVSLIIGNYASIPYSEEENALLRRFANVFEQSYTRFLDLQKAEAQAREAQIEAALERVRSKTMAMHNSQDVGESVATLFDELVKLGVKTNRCGILIFNDPQFAEVWTAKANANEKATLVIGKLDMNMHPMLVGARACWANKEPFFSYELKGQDMINYYQSINNSKYYPTQFNLEALPVKEIHSEFYFSEGCLFAFTSEALPVESAAIFKRFTSVFGQTYRRYLDLQKAEASAREATIEAALEKVRGKAMAMHNSSDVSAAASMVFTELRKLGISPIRCGVGLLSKESARSQLYSATTSTEGESLSLVGWVILAGHPVLEKIYDAWKTNEDYFPVLTGEELKSYYKSLLSEFAVPSIPSSEQKQFGLFLPIGIGCLYAWADAPYSEAEIKILKRFASIIDLTFRRYLELQRAEANALEALRSASLDRVRAEIASMRTKQDLERITPLIWKELTTLGIPFVRCGVFIMDEQEELIHTFLSTPDGKAIAAFHLPYNSNPFVNAIEEWRAKKIHVTHWGVEEFSTLANSLVNEGQIATREQYLSTVPKDGLYLHYIPFLQGIVYVGNATTLTEDKLHLIQSVADTFSTAYARYEDFNRLELAKQQVEKTLTDLKSTQALLVQSEKMASLGELTAGIAHEIQNPLNFVNNFSEVSNELIDEMLAELATGNLELVAEISKDLKDNLTKINHHGKRAGSIVSGMLLHSRTSKGIKEPTDINALADEYLRLAYHGLRAKDKTFNAKFETVFDETIGKLNIIPQDIGRVILNLITNAFYAVNERQKLGASGYQPTVTVTTRKANGKVEVRVQDNGTGIPQKVIDKIFQPFFTTKPTGQGTGLGLSLSYDIVKAHGGELKVETKAGEGSEFVVALPII